MSLFGDGKDKQLIPTGKLLGAMGLLVIAIGFTMLISIFIAFVNIVLVMALLSILFLLKIKTHMISLFSRGRNKSTTTTE